MRTFTDLISHSILSLISIKSDFQSLIARSTLDFNLHSSRCRKQILSYLAATNLHNNLWFLLFVPSSLSSINQAYFLQTWLAATLFVTQLSCLEHVLPISLNAPSDLDNLIRTIGSAFINFIVFHWVRSLIDRAENMLIVIWRRAIRRSLRWSKWCEAYHTFYKRSKPGWFLPIHCLFLFMTTWYWVLVLRR